MDKALSTAIDYARRGWYVFPIQPGTKFPYKGFKWKEKSTNDPAIVKKAGASKRYAGCNWALDCGRSDVFVLDVDVKPNINGWDTFQSKGWSLDHAGILVGTPSGGSHVYYKGQGPNSSGKLGPGLDTRGAGGYVLIPGSSNGNGKPYKFKDSNPKISSIPKWLIQQLGAPTQRKEKASTPLTELDQEHNIELATTYLIHEAPQAIQGQSGDATTLRVAFKLRDLGISQQKAYELMLLNWNEPKARPPWPPHELKKKVENAYTYAKDQPGNATPDALFPNPIQSGGLFATFRELVNTQIKVDYVVKPYIEKDTITVWFGGFAEFKTFAAISLGINKAAGIPWAGRELEPGTVWYLAGEGRGGLQRRVKAAQKQLQIPQDKEIPFLVSNLGVPLNDMAVVDWILTNAASHIKTFGKPEIVFIDTLAAHFGGSDENSTKDMGQFLSVVQELRKRLGCAIILLHHPGHGDKSRSRGSYSLEAGVDAVYKISREDMHVCVHSPKKMKDGEPPSDTWFEAQIIKVGLDDDLDPITSLAIEFDPDFAPAEKPRRLGANQQFIFERVLEAGTSVKELYQAFKEWKGDGFRRQNYYRAVKALLDGEICFERDGVLFKRL